MSKIIVFPGQGSQAIGMGNALFDEFPDKIQLADNILGYSVKNLCLEDKDGTLISTEFTQPALYVVNHLSYLAGGFKPDYLAGHSLGEFNALTAAGVFDFETGLKLVQKRGQLMAEAPSGGMAAVLGLSEDKVNEVLSRLPDNNIDLANINSPTQLIISGPKEAIASAEEAFKNAGAKRYIVLNVSGAFHSRYMEGPKKESSSSLDQFTFNAPQIPVIANVTAEPYVEEDIKKTITDQLTGSVKWLQTIKTLASGSTPEFEEVGPGKVLTGLIRQCLKGG